MSHMSSELCCGVWDEGPEADPTRHTCFRAADHDGAHRCLCSAKSERGTLDGPDTPATHETAGEGR